MLFRSDWFRFDDAQITSMDGYALEWWNKYKEILRLILSGNLGGNNGE